MTHSQPNPAHDKRFTYQCPTCGRRFIPRHGTLLPRHNKGGDRPFIERVMECPGSYQLAVRYREFKEHDDVYNKQLSEFGVVKSVERRTDVNRVRDVLVVRVRDSSILKDGEYTWFAEYCELLSEIPCPPSPK